MPAKPVFVNGRPQEPNAQASYAGQQAQESRKAQLASGRKPIQVYQPKTYPAHARSRAGKIQEQGHVAERQKGEAGPKGEQGDMLEREFSTQQGVDSNKQGVAADQHSSIGHPGQHSGN